jgi:hypothetical protein
VPRRIGILVKNEKNDIINRININTPKTGNGEIIFQTRRQPTFHQSGRAVFEFELFFSRNLIGKINKQRKNFKKINEKV